MAEESEGPPLDAVPGGEMSNIPGVRKLSLRAEIDTSPPFGSVKEAVDRFGGSGPWVPFYKLAHEIGEIDIKKVEEQATALEKDLIVKELETLDILEELNTTKRIVEELKRQLKDEALRCMKQRPPPEFPSSETKKEQDQNWGPSSDLILMELKQAKLNLGRTIQELGAIQNSVENLNKKMKMEKDLLGKILESKEVKTKGGDLEMKSKSGDEVKIKMVDQIQGNLVNSGERQSIPCLRTAEMRLIAAKKMEEAARAAEAVAIAEIRSLSAGNAEEFYGFFVPEPEPEQSPPTPRIPMQKFPEPNFAPFSISTKLQEATQEVKQSKMALEEALSKMELASKKQIAAEEALRRWMPEQDQTPLTPSSDHPLHHHRPPQRSPLHALMNPIPAMATNDARPSLKPQVSMRDVLSRKQVTPEECVVKRQSEVAENGRQKVALSQMLHQVREDAAFPAKRERDVEEQRAPPLYPPRTERRRFGFIHIALPMAKQSKKKPQVLN